MESIVGLATNDGFVLAGIDHHFVPTNRYFYAFFTKDVPEFLDERFDSVLYIVTHIFIEDKVCIKLRCVFLRTIDVLEAEVWRRECQSCFC
jgi:hypothetical protein